MKYHIQSGPAYKALSDGSYEATDEGLQDWCKANGVEYTERLRDGVEHYLGFELS